MEPGTDHFLCDEEAFACDLFAVGLRLMWLLCCLVAVAGDRLLTDTRSHFEPKHVLCCLRTVAFSNNRSYLTTMGMHKIGRYAYSLVDAVSANKTFLVWMKLKGVLSHPIVAPSDMALFGN